MRQLRWLLVVLAAMGCGLPKNVVRPPSSALVDARHTTLGELITPAVAKHPGESGFLLFNTGEGAIQARVALADVAQSSIDAQYFMWGRDTVGRVLLERLIAAANRGVRIRLLIDDYWDTVNEQPRARSATLTHARLTAQFPRRGSSLKSLSRTGPGHIGGLDND
jgi:phosphatidylserine/phosphatidylglycerophosphate/cardiolipin synthase-like enzyme